MSRSAAARPVSLADYETLARERLDPGVLGYVAGGAGDEITLRDNEAAFARLYDLVAPRVYGLIRRVLRDPAQAEEVAQEVLVEVWRTATRFDAARGSAASWIFTIAHRRAVDRVRAEQASTDRMMRVGAASAPSPMNSIKSANSPCSIGTGTSPPRADMATSALYSCIDHDA